jgi:hypothetical protein
MTKITFRANVIHAQLDEHSTIACEVGNKGMSLRRDDEKGKGSGGEGIM